MKQMISAILMTGALTSSALADTYRAVNHMTVTPQSAGTFVVTGQAELWARDYWCAAGEYGQRVLGLPVTARLYVDQPYQRGSTAVGFRTDANGAERSGLVLLGNTVRNEGSNQSVGQARGYCADRNLRVTR
jgi:hypothetical protein